MDQVRMIEVKQSVFADNDRRAAQLRDELRERGIFLLNLMNAPGSGKTTTLKRTVELAILENVGNLICPAEFDTGAVKNAAILSAPEGGR